MARSKRPTLGRKHWNDDKKARRRRESSCWHNRELSLVRPFAGALGELVGTGAPHSDTVKITVVELCEKEALI
jgi:hypothetical protein